VGKKLTPGEKRVLGVLRQVRYAGIPEIAKRAGLNADHARELLKDLCRRGLAREHVLTTAPGVRGRKPRVYSAVEFGLASVKPLKPLRDLDPSREFGTFDVETFDGLRGVELACWSCAVGPAGGKPELLQDVQTDLTDCVELLSSRAPPRRRDYLNCYVHNLQFDVRHVLAHCQRAGIETKLVGTSKIVAVTLPRERVRFVDSLQFLPAPQHVLEQSFGVDPELRKIDCSSIFEKPGEDWTDSEFDRVLAHNANDVLALHQIIAKLRQELFSLCGRDLLDYPTPATLAVAAWRGTLTRPVPTPTVRVDKSQGRWRYQVRQGEERIAREAYRGGRCEVLWRGLFPAPDGAVLVDVNSLYPSVMAGDQFRYPLGRAWFARSAELEDALRDESLAGVAAADVVPPDDLLYPVLWSQVGGRLAFRLAPTSGTWTLSELREAVKCGYSVYPRRGLLSESAPGGEIFGDYVGRLFEEKAHARGARRAGVKLLLNSLYGKLGEKGIQERYEYEFHQFALLAFERASELGLKDGEFAVMGHPPILVYKAETRRVRPYQNVLLAAHVTAHGRLVLSRVLRGLQQAGVPAAYCDTDSVVVPAKALPRFPAPMGSGLGEWAVEAAYGQFAAAAPKVYAAFDEKGALAKLKAKGVPRQMLRGLERGADSPEKLLARLREPLESPDHYLSVKAAARRHSTVLSAAPLKRRLTLRDSKRAFLPGGKSVPWADTIPRADGAVAAEPCTRSRPASCPYCGAAAVRTATGQVVCRCGHAAVLPRGLVDSTSTAYFAVPE